MPTTYNAAPGIDVVSSSVQIPGLGFVPVNAFVLHGSEPVLVDTGVVVEHEEFMTALRSVIDPADLKWIWLTHPDADHIGTLHQLLAENPNIRVITQFLSVGILGLSAPLPMDRVFLINPGQSITVGDRTLTAMKPPAFDNPATMGFFDDKSNALFSSDCFGALLQAVPERADELSADELRLGQVTWATIDSPWLHRVSSDVVAKELHTIRERDLSMLFSSHLPPAPGSMIDQVVGSLELVPSADPFVGPDQAALQAMMAGTAGPPA